MEEEINSVIVSEQSLTTSRSDAKVSSSAFWVALNEFLFLFLIRFLLRSSGCFRLWERSGLALLSWERLVTSLEKG